MTKKFKRILSALLVAVMLVGIAPVSGLALDGDEALSYLTYEINDGEVTITNCLDHTLIGVLTIPSTIEGYPVTSIGDYAFEYCSELTSITIPDSVTSFGVFAFGRCTGLTSITIPDSVTSIGDDAFYGCTGLTSITIPYGVTSIGAGAFCECSGLTNITIPDSVIKICDVTFYGCSGLKSVTIGNGITYIGNQAFGNCTNLINVVIPDSVSLIYTNAFEYCTGLTSVIIGDGVTYIADEAFEYCTSLTSVTIGNGVTNIGREAFYNCTKLMSVFVPIMVKSIEENAFGYIDDYKNNDFKILCCANTEGERYAIDNGFDYELLDSSKVSYLGYEIVNGEVNITECYPYITGECVIPRTIAGYPVTSIGDDAFSSCSGLTSITIPDSVTSIGDDAFSSCSGLTSITVPYGVTSIGAGAFYGCSGLTSITIPDSVTSIGDYAFYGCSGLTSISVGSNNKAYDSRGKCNAIIETATNTLIQGCQNTIIPDSVTSIGDFAFYGCSGLVSLVIPSSVTDIETHAFDECINLKKIETHDGIVSIGDRAFENCKNLMQINIPESVISMGEGVFWGCSNLENITVDINNSNYSSDSYGVLFDKEKTILLQYPLAGEQNAYSIPNSVTIIETYAFGYCLNLVEITIPKTVSEIRFAAFNGCKKLESIVIPEGITIIEGCLFQECYALKNVTLPDTLIQIGGAAFYNCSSLEYIDIPNDVTTIGYNSFHGCSSLKKIKIPDKVTFIDHLSFSDCISLSEVIIPEGVKSIGFKAFFGCINLKSVTIPKSLEWHLEYPFGYCFNEDDELCKIQDFKIYCYADTIGEYYAINNGFDYEILSNAHSHTLSHIVISATCTVNGMEYDICTECGETFNAETLPLAAHTWGEWAVVKEPTTTAEGQEKRVCSVCGEEETRAIAKINGIRDGETGIEIVYEDEFADGTELKVEQQFDGASFQLINTAYGQTNSVIYDIATYKDGIKVQPDGEITVRVPLPEGFNPEKVFVCFVDSTNGKVTTLPCEVKDGYVTFKTDHFSYYAIVEQTAKVNSVSVGDITLNYKKTATITPIIEADEGAEYTVTYTSSNPSVARVDENGKVYGAKKGSADITVTVTDSYGNSVSDTCKVNVTYAWWQWIIVIVLFGWIWY